MPHDSNLRIHVLRTRVLKIKRQLDQDGRAASPIIVTSTRAPVAFCVG
jgi:hypothetical protein